MTDEPTPMDADMDTFSRPVAEAPPDHLWHKNRIDVRRSIVELWEARQLVRTLAERDFKARYTQSVLGIGWALFTPLALMVVFSLVFGRFADIDTGDVPYPLFSYAALIPWTFFATSLAQGGISLLNNKELLNKVWCPREVFAIASSVVAGIDALIATSALVVLMVIYGVPPASTIVWAPILLVLLVVVTIAVAVVASAIVVHLRDVRHALPILLQLGVIASPVAYPIDEFIDDRWHVVYSFVNPLAPVLDGLRRTAILGEQPDWTLVGCAAISSVVLLVGSFAAFRRLESGLADVA